MKRMIAVISLAIFLCIEVLVIKGSLPVYSTEKKKIQITQATPANANNVIVSSGEKEKKNESGYQNIRNASKWENFEQRMDQIVIDTEPIDD